jgi:xanthine dehydrogenase accessory factor
VTLPRDMEVAQAKNERAVAANPEGTVVCGVGNTTA